MALPMPSDACTLFDRETGEQRASQTRNLKSYAICSAFVLGMMVAAIALFIVQHCVIGDASFVFFFLSPAVPRAHPTSGAIVTSVRAVRAQVSNYKGHRLGRASIAVISQAMLPSRAQHMSISLPNMKYASQPRMSIVDDDTKKQAVEEPPKPSQQPAAAVNETSNTAYTASAFRVGKVLTLHISDMAFDGKGIARVPTEKGLLVVFVQNAIPGQTVEAKVVKRKRSYVECSLLSVIQKSHLEIDLPYQPIPGAPYASVPLEQQRAWKEQTVLDLYRKLGSQHDIDEKYGGLVQSPSSWHYRNKMEYSFSSIRYDLELGDEIDGFGLGFKHRGTWWAVENLDSDSGLFDAEVEAKLHKVRNWCQQTGLPAWNPRRSEGFFKLFTVRKSYVDDQLLFDLTTTSDGALDVDGFTQLILDVWGNRVRGILHTTMDDGGLQDEVSHLLWGDSAVTEVLNGLKFRISMRSFFQTNPKSAERLYSEVVSLALEGMDEHPGSTVMDLFCGTGTIGQILAAQTSATVVGVDIVEQAIDDAHEAARLNKISNVQFITSDVGKFLLEHPEYKSKIHTVVIDPPRAGISAKTLRKVLRLGAQRLVYVSCNPATQARDLVTMQEFGYVLRSLKLFDQFPHTAHVEAVALVEKDAGPERDVD